MSSGAGLLTPSLDDTSAAERRPRGASGRNHTNVHCCVAHCRQGVCGVCLATSCVGPGSPLDPAMQRCARGTRSSRSSAQKRRIADQSEELCRSVEQKGRLVGWACRVAMGTEDNVSVKRRREDRLFELHLIRERNLARVPAPPSATAAAAPAADSGEKRVKLATVLDQTNDMEVKELDGEVVKEAYERFAAVTGGGARAP